MKLSIALITLLSLANNVNVSGFTTLNTKPYLLSGTQLASSEAAEGGEVNGAATNNMGGRPTVKPILDSVDSTSNLKNLDIRSLKRYNAVLHGLATCGDYNTAKELLLQSMTYSNDIKPDVISYNCLLNAYSKLGMGYEAQELLYYMYNNKDILGFVPNEISYTTTLLAWGRHTNTSNNDNAAQNAQDLFYTIQKWSNADPDIIPPSIYCFNSVLYAWSKVHNGAINAESFLRNMMEENNTNQTNKNKIIPNIVSYNTLLSAWVKHTSKKAPYKAEELLNEIQCLADEHINIKPNFITFNTVIDAWAKKSNNNINSAKRCELLLRYMEDMYKLTNDDNYKPDVCSYSTVVNAYSKSKKRGISAQFAEIVLNDMLKNNFDLPNSVIFNTVINAWSKSGEKDAAIRAHAILDHMEELNSSNDKKYKNVKPDIFSYTSVIDTYAKIGTEESANKANHLLHKIEAIYNTTHDISIQPNIKTYTSLLNAYSRSKQPYKALNVIQQMNNFATLHNLSDNLKMDTITCNALINAWGWSNEHTIKAKEAYKIYIAMKNKHHQNNNDSIIKPDLITINSVLNACAFTKTNDDIIKKDALDIAIKLYEEITSSSSSSNTFDIKPNDTTYGTMILICGKLSSNNIILRHELIQSIFWKCCNDGYVSYFVISQLRSVLQFKLNNNNEDNDDEDEKNDEYDEQSSLELYQKLVLDYIDNNDNDTSSATKHDNIDKSTHDTSLSSSPRFLSKNNVFGYVDIMTLPKEWSSNVIHTNSRKKKYNNNYKKSNYRS